jgi:hypothetical protein
VSIGQVALGIMAADYAAHLLGGSHYSSGRLYYSFCNRNGTFSYEDCVKISPCGFNLMWELAHADEELRTYFLSTIREGHDNSFTEDEYYDLEDKKFLYLKNAIPLLKDPNKLREYAIRAAEVNAESSNEIIQTITPLQERHLRDGEGFTRRERIQLTHLLSELEVLWIRGAFRRAEHIMREAHERALREGHNNPTAPIDMAQLGRTMLEQFPFLIDVYTNGIKDQEGVLLMPLDESKMLIMHNYQLADLSFVVYLTSPEFYDAVASRGEQTVADVILARFL